MYVDGASTDNADCSSDSPCGTLLQALQGNTNGWIANIQMKSGTHCSE